MQKVATMSVDSLRSNFHQLSRSCSDLGSQFMARLMALFGERVTPGIPVIDSILHWPGDPAPYADNPCIRLAGSLQALVISGADSNLAAVYPPHSADDEQIWSQVQRAMTEHMDHILAWLTRPPQTNEVGRSAALIPVWHMIAEATKLPLALWEIGCSAGLNLRADKFRLQVGADCFGPENSPVALAPMWHGPVPKESSVEIAERRGVDLSPMDLENPNDKLRLRAYIWPDQKGRRERTDAAIAIALKFPARIKQDDAVEWLRRSLNCRPDGMTTVIFHTVAWQYLSPEARAEGDSLIAKAGACATVHSPLVRIEMEFDGQSMAALYVTVWPNGQRHFLARVDFHGRSVNWSGVTTLKML